MSSRNYALVAFGCLISYVIISKLVSYIQCVRFSKAHGCKPVPKVPQSETFLGWQMMQQQIRERKHKRFLDKSKKRFEKYGDTFQLTVSGMTSIATIDPENIKAVLATNFKEFDIGHRLPVFGPLFGSGIFTTDGHLHEEELDEETQNTATECLGWLQGAHFLDQAGYAICDDQGLQQRSKAFYMKYAPRIKAGSEKRITALRFTQRATLPVKAGATVVLIPIHVISGSPSIAGRAVKLGWAIHLTEDVSIDPGFYCLALLAQ